MTREELKGMKRGLASVRLGTEEQALRDVLSGCLLILDRELAALDATPEPAPAPAGNPWILHALAGRERLATMLLEFNSAYLSQKRFECLRNIKFDDIPTGRGGVPHPDDTRKAILAIDSVYSEIDVQALQAITGPVH